MIIRTVTEKDAHELLEIYRPYVENTAITFEYDVPSVEEFSDRIIGLKDGNVVFDGTPSEMNEEILRSIYLSLEDAHLS